MKKLSKVNGVIQGLAVAAAVNIVFYFVSDDVSGPRAFFTAVIFIFISLVIYGATYKTDPPQK